MAMNSHRLHMQNVVHRKCDVIGICLTLAVGAAEAVSACACVAIELVRAITVLAGIRAAFVELCKSNDGSVTQL